MWMTIKPICMNWGNRLILVFAAFAALMTYMVYRCMQTPVDLVAKEYYRDELAYQQVIDGTRNAQTLSAKPTLQQDTANITIQLPAEMKQTAVKGSILFYCAADARKDRRLALQPDAAAKQQIPLHHLQPGNYTVKITWESNNRYYYTEESFTIL